MKRKMLYAFIAMQLVDFSITFWVKAQYGPDHERNQYVKWMMKHTSFEEGLFIAKVAVILSGMYLYYASRKIPCLYKIMNLLTAYYLFWVIVMFFL